jgi:nitrite reductase (NADH) large subunit
MLGDSIVCSCNLVSTRMLVAAIGSGCRSMADVTALTRACTGCGSCKPAVQAMLAGLETVPLVRPMRLLAGVAGLALLLAVALPLARVPLVRRLLPVPESWDFLGRDPMVQQATGYGVLGLFALALLLPLRRRLGMGFIRSGNFWRVMHGLVGVGLCGLLLAHTSARLGQGFNLALSVTALVLVVAGALLGLVWRRGPPQTQLAARTLRPLHLALFWPTLTFIAVHVLAVYYF